MQCSKQRGACCELAISTLSYTHKSYDLLHTLCTLLVPTFHYAGHICNPMTSTIGWFLLLFCLKIFSFTTDCNLLRFSRSSLHNFLLLLEILAGICNLLHICEKTLFPSKIPHRCWSLIDGNVLKG